jgi:hypothetical protein
MQRYDALLEDDPEGGWVHYEDVQEILEQGAAVNDSLHNRIEQNEKSIADWKTRFLQKESIIGSLRTSLAATNDALKERIRISNQLFRDFEVEQRYSDRLHARIGGLYSMIAVSVLANIALAVTFYLEIVGDIVGKIN